MAHSACLDFMVLKNYRQLGEYVGSMTLASPPPSAFEPARRRGMQGAMNRRVFIRLTFLILLAGVSISVRAGDKMIWPYVETQDIPISQFEAATGL